MVMSSVVFTATAAGTGPELVYTVDFRGTDGKFAPAALNQNATDYFTYTPSADGSSVTVTGSQTDAKGTASKNAWWGGLIDGLTANKTTAYTMIYKLKADSSKVAAATSLTVDEANKLGQNNSISVGGWVTDKDVTTAADGVNKIYNMYGNYNTMGVEETEGTRTLIANANRRAKLQHGKSELAAYKMWNTLPAVEEDSDGFVTLKLTFNANGESRMFAYVLADGKTGTADTDWIQIAGAKMTLDDTDDGFGFAIYGVYYGAINTTVKNVQIYKETVTPPTSLATYTPNTSYDLTISEMCNSPEDDTYEYIEVVNTSNAAINIKDYYLFRLGFSHGGKYEYSGLQQMFGLKSGQNLAKLTAVSLESYDVTLNPGEIAVIWFVSAPGAALTVADFKNYWRNEGADEVDSTKIVRFENYTKTTDTSTNSEVITTTYPASYINVGVKDSNKETFLPDSKAGFAVGLMKASKANSTLQVPSVNENGANDGSLPDRYVALKDLQPLCDQYNVTSKKVVSVCTADITANLIKAFDSIAIGYTYGSVETGYSYNFYSKVDATQYGEATANPTDFIMNNITPKITETSYLYPALVWGQSKVRGYYDSSSDYNSATAKSNSAVFVDDGTRLLPSPGKLWNEQFGTDGDIPSFDAAKGVSSIVVIRWTPDVK